MQIRNAYIRGNRKHMDSQQDKGSFRRVGVVARHHTETILESVLTVEAVLQRAEIDVVVDADTASVLPQGAHKIVEKSALENLDLVVVVGGDVANVSAFVVPRCGADAAFAARALAEGKVFQGGNWNHLHRMLQLSTGSALMYVGDHMYSDILRSKRTLGLRLSLIHI